MDHNGHIALWLTMMEGQQSLTRCWCKFPRWGRECFTYSFPHEGSQYFIYDYFHCGEPHIMQDTRPTIMDTSLTLIVMLGQGGYRNLFSL
jgi:hypothetical protein